MDPGSMLKLSLFPAFHAFPPSLVAAARLSRSSSPTFLTRTALAVSTFPSPRSPHSLLSVIFPGKPFSHVSSYFCDHFSPRHGLRHGETYRDRHLDS